MTQMDAELEQVLELIDRNYDMRQLAVEARERKQELGFAVYYEKPKGSKWEDPGALKVTELFEGDRDSITFTIPPNTILVGTFHTHGADESAGMSAGDHVDGVKKLLASGGRQGAPEGMTDRLYIIVGTPQEYSIDVFDADRVRGGPTDNVISNASDVDDQYRTQLAVDIMSSARLGAMHFSYPNSNQFRGRAKGRAYGSRRTSSGRGKGWYGERERHGEAAKKGWGK